MESGIRKDHRTICMKEEIIRWLKQGCNLSDGITLYSRYGNNDQFKHLLKIQPESCKRRLRLSLAILAGVDSCDPCLQAKQEGDKFRAMYPFLSDKDCPRELKLLATDKMTTYWRCVELHEELFSCHSNQQCLSTAKELVETFIEDQSIKQELEYYKKHGGILGKHRVFAENKRLDSIRRMNIRELIQKEKRLRDNIWRIKSELSKANKPHLQREREIRLRQREEELQLVESILNG